MKPTRVLFDDPGPRGRRRVAVATVVISVLIVAVLYLALRQLSDSGQLDLAKWKPFWQQWAVAFLAEGLWGTLLVTGASALVSFPVGGLLAVGRAGQNRPVRWLCTAYIEVFRSVPTLLLVYVFLFALPGVGLNVSIFWKLTVPIILINSAVIAEIVRAGIRSLDRGQTEAALAVGMTPGLAMRLVVMPQAVKLVHLGPHFDDLPALDVRECAVCPGDRFASWLQTAKVPGVHTCNGEAHGDSVPTGD